MFPLGYTPNRRGDQVALGVARTPVALPAGPQTWDVGVRITAPGQTYTVDINAGTNPEIRVDWGDGTVENFVTTGLKTHTYQLVKTHTVKISGRFKSGGNIRLGSDGGNRHRVIKTGVIPLIPGFISFESAFESCSGITNIPRDLFKYNPQITTSGFNRTFANCSGINSVPSDLFRYNTSVSTAAFRATFQGSGLSSIPNDLFRYNTLASTLAFSFTFSSCSKLTSIPADLFRYNQAVTTDGFYRAFLNCTSLTSLPTDLFRYNTAVSTSGFLQAFKSCTGLTSLPTDLFKYNTAVSTSGFYGAFDGCTGLTSLPTDLFRYNTAATSFFQTFYGCTKLQQNATIFYADGEQSTRFLNKSVDFTNCFYLTSFSGTTGVAPDLWNCDFGTGAATKTDCWQGHSVSTVSNFGSIPADWT